jgi:hypothetical protein
MYKQRESERPCILLLIFDVIYVYKSKITMKKLIFPIVGLVAALLFSCEENKNARIEVWLTDAPGDYQAVNIDIQGVEVNGNEADHNNGWQALEVDPKVCNLMELANGNETFLGDLELPGGKISQIRLILGESNTIVDKDGNEHELKTPSAGESGLKIQIHQVLQEGITYKILLDFEAGRSVVKTGSDNYILKPVIRTLSTEAQDGAVKGDVSPPGIVAISVYAADTLFTSASTNADGEFLIRGMEPGTYKFVFDAGSETPDVEQSDVVVAVGEVTDLGEISME